MLNGIYKCTITKQYANTGDEVFTMGDIIVRAKDSEKSLALTLLENTVRYDAPQIDDMFRENKTIKINKRGSKHAYNEWGDNSFTLYPYRVGVPYIFELITE